MHQETLAFIKLMQINEAAETSIPLWAAEIALTYIVDDNVDEMLQLIAGSSDTTSAEFWAIVNRAPTDDSDWAALQVIGAGLSESGAATYKAIFRRSVEVIRRHVAHGTHDTK